MPLLPYCMVEEGPAISAPAHGVQSASVETISVPGLRAFYSQMESLVSDAATLKQSALEFHNVVSSLFQQTTVLPFRFPTLLADIEELASHLMANAELYRQDLKRLRGMAQMEVRITTGAGEVNVASGTEYLRSRRARQAALRSMALEVRTQSQHLLSDWRERETKNGWRCYALINTSAANKFEEMVRCLNAPAGVQFGVSGPWPPTEFISQPNQ